MYKTSPVKLHRAATVFSKFCSDMEILPSYTPLFLIDLSGRIVNKRKLVTKKEDFESIYNLVFEQELPFMLEESACRDAYAVKGNIDDGKNFIVVSKDRDGFSRCVVCSYSEDKCIRLHDYIEKLCSYKDYLDSFSDLAFSSAVRLPAKRLFRMKISGATELVNLAMGKESDNGRRISFPVSLALEKLCAFASKASGGEAVLEKNQAAAETVVNAPEEFFRLVVSAAALVMRHGTNSKVHVSVKKNVKKQCARIAFTSKRGAGEKDIYERELILAFRRRGLDCDVTDGDDEYSLYIDVPLEKREKLVLSDVFAISVMLDDLMDEQVVRDMYYTISDI